MTKFYNYDLGLFDAKDEDLDKIIFYTTSDSINRLGTYRIDNEYYRWCTGRKGEDGLYSYIGVKKLEMNFDNKEEEYEQYIKCPICGDEEYDSWEYDEDEGEYTCNCGAELEYVRSITVEYSTEVRTIPDIIEI